jgi:RNA polymerase sigma-70 factor (ECF subfamily)
VTDGTVNYSGGGNSTSISLLQRVRDNDAKAWVQLVEVYSPLVFRWCRRSGLQQADVEDLCQEVFRSVYRGLPGFRLGKPDSSFRAWLRTIAINRVRDHLAKRPAIGRGGSDAAADLAAVADPVSAESDDDIQEVSILYRRLTQVMRNDFEEKTWQSFSRVVIDGEAVETVAADLGMTPNAIYLAKARVLHRLREALTELGEDKHSPGRGNAK